MTTVNLVADIPDFPVTLTEQAFRMHVAGDDAGLLALMKSWFAANMTVSVAAPAPQPAAAAEDNPAPGAEEQPAA